MSSSGVILFSGQGRAIAMCVLWPAGGSSPSPSPAGGWSLSYLPPPTHSSASQMNREIRSQSLQEKFSRERKSILLGEWRARIKGALTPPPLFVHESSSVHRKEEQNGRQLNCVVRASIDYTSERLTKLGPRLPSLEYILRAPTTAAAVTLILPKKKEKLASAS